MRYAFVRSGVVVTAFDTDRPRSDFPDVADLLFEAPAEVQQGWYHDGSTFAAKPFRTLEQAKAEARERIANARWREETSGVVIGGVLVSTDDRSKTMLTAAAIKAGRDPAFTTQWKQADGSFVTLAAAEILALFDAVSDFVDTLFKKEEALTAQIDAATTVEEADAVTW